MKTRTLVWLQTLVFATVVLTAAIAFGATEKAPIATVKIGKSPELYAVDPSPLTPSQCGQCHPGYYKSLRTDGARHQFDCQKCHTSIHSYNPKKGNYEALMPKCASCHDAPHGKVMVDCATCHTNPHTPKKVAMGPRLLNNCTECHTGPKQQLAQFPSKHTKVACQKCHTSHGYIPQCSNCHKPHYANQAMSTCTKCHPVHRPLQIAWEKETANTETCNACHAKIVSKWKASPSRHAKVACAQCHHTKHRYKPKCQECHPTPHKPDFLKRFPSCLTCHLDVHDPPVKKAKTNGK
jgi:hypothetical protein